MEPSQNSNKYDIETVAKELGLKPERVKILLEKFNFEISKNINILKEAIADKDFEKLAKTAHRLKGSSMNLRLNNIAGLFKEIEVNAKESKAIDYNEIIDKISNSIDLNI